jgi:hypothetical protein
MPHPGIASWLWATSDRSCPAVSICGPHWRPLGPPEVIPDLRNSLVGTPPCPARSPQPTPPRRPQRCRSWCCHCMEIIHQHRNARQRVAACWKPLSGWIRWQNTSRRGLRPIRSAWRTRIGAWSLAGCEWGAIGPPRAGGSASQCRQNAAPACGMQRRCCRLQAAGDVVGLVLRGRQRHSLDTGRGHDGQRNGRHR